MVKWCWKFPRTRKRGIGALGLCWLVVPLVGAAAEDAEVESPPKSMTLDQLLTLPSALSVGSGQRNTVRRSEWYSSGILSGGPERTRLWATVPPPSSKA